MDATTIVTGASFASLVLEGVKQLLRLIPALGKDFDFPTKFYLIVLPVLQVLVSPVLVYLGMVDGALTLDWKSVVVVLIQSLVSVVIYNQGIKPLKEYYTRLNG